MRICHLLDTLAMGGAEKVAAITAVALSNRGHEVTLAAYHPGNALESLTLGSGVAVEIISSGKAGRLMGLRRLLSRGRFEVVHAYKMPVAIWGRGADLGLPGAAWFIGQHALSSDSATVRWLGGRLCRNVAGWVVPSAAAAEVVFQDYRVERPRVHVVPNPVDLARLNRTASPRDSRRTLGLPENTFVVSIIANLHPWKNHTLFLRAARRLADARKDIMFLVAGRDELSGAVQAECRALGLDHCFRFLGHVENVSSVLAATDVMAITSPQESFCLALAEAGAMGVACVSTDNGGGREVIVDGKTGVIVRCNDDISLADAIHRLLNDDALRESMGAAARAWVQARFDPETVTSCLEALYSDAIGRVHS